MKILPTVAARFDCGRHRLVGVGCHNIIIATTGAKGRSAHGFRVGV
jgi:hypothetical protein